MIHRALDEAREYASRVVDGSNAGNNNGIIIDSLQLVYQDAEKGFGRLDA